MFVGTTHHQPSRSPLGCLATAKPPQITNPVALSRIPSRVELAIASFFFGLWKVEPLSVSLICGAIHRGWHDRWTFRSPRMSDGCPCHHHRRRAHRRVHSRGCVCDVAVTSRARVCNAIVDVRSQMFDGETDVNYKQVIFLCKQVFSDLELLYTSLFWCRQVIICDLENNLFTHQK